MGMIGWTEVAIILVVVILVLGPAKLPLLGEGLGKMLRGFRKEMKAMDQDKAEERTKKQAELEVTAVPSEDSSKLSSQTKTVQEQSL